MKNLFIGVDLQKDFMNKDGALYVNGSEEIKENIEVYIEGIIEKIKRNPEDNKLMLTLDSHLKGDAEISDNPDFVTTFPPHCMRNEPGFFHIDEVITNVEEIVKEDYVFDVKGKRISIYFKNEFSVFKGNKEFLDDLKTYYNDVENIYLFGVAGDICVRGVIDGLIQNKNKGINFNTIFVKRDCIASISDENFYNYLNELMKKYDFIKVL